MAVPTMTNNSPAAGSIAWGAFSIQYMGVSYSIAAGSTALRWVWWRYNAGASVIEAGATIPSNLTDDDLVLFGNKNGIGIRVQATSLVDGELLVDGSIFSDALSTNLVNSTHIVTAGLDAGVIKFGVMAGDRLAANSVTTEKLTVGALGPSMIGNGNFQDPLSSSPGQGGGAADWVSASTGGSFYRETHASAPGGVWGVLKSPGGTGNHGRALSSVFPVQAGDVLAVAAAAARTASTSGGFYLRIGWFATKPADTSLAEGDSGVVDIAQNVTVPSTYTDLASWGRYVGAVTVPANVKFARITLYNFQGTVESYILVSGVEVQKVVVSAQIGDGAVTALKVKAGEINSGHVTTLGLDAAVIKFGTMHGDRIAANTITVGKLTVGTLGDSLVRNGNFEEDGYWTLGTAATRIAAAAQGGSFGLRLAANGGVGLVSQAFPCAVGDTVAVVASARGLTGPTGLYLRFSWRNAAGAELGISDPLVAAPVPVGTWTKYVGNAIAPAGTVNAVFQVYNTQGTVDVDDVSVNMVLLSAQIGDGQVLASKVKAGEINSAHVTTTGLDAAVVKFGLMHGDRIEVGTLKADRIGANTFTGITFNGLTISNPAVLLDPNYLLIRQLGANAGGIYLDANGGPADPVTGLATPHIKFLSAYTGVGSPGTLSAPSRFSAQMYMRVDGSLTIGNFDQTGASGGLRIGAGGTPVKTFTHGEFNGNTNASAQVVINHGLGAQPINAGVLVNETPSGAGRHVVTFAGATTTTITFTVRNTAGGLVNAATRFYWQAWS